MRRLLPSAVAAIALLAIVPTPAPGQDSAATAAPAPAKKRRGDINRITKDDLEGSQATFVTALDMIRTLRPRWLNRGFGRVSTSNADGTTGGATEIVLYIDDNRQPSLNELTTVRAANVVEIRYLDQNRAIQMRGVGHELGAIEVITTAKAR